MSCNVCKHKHVLRGPGCEQLPERSYHAGLFFKDSIGQTVVLSGPLLSRWSVVDLAGVGRGVEGGTWWGPQAPGPRGPVEVSGEGLGLWGFKQTLPNLSQEGSEGAKECSPRGGRE